MQLLIVEEKKDGEVKRVIVPVDEKGGDQFEGGGIALILRLKRVTSRRHAFQR